MKRLGVSPKVRHYFTLHAVLDVRHDQAWNAEAIQPLVEENARCARLIAEGALIRLACGQACFERYRRQFDLRGTTQRSSPAMTDMLRNGAERLGLSAGMKIVERAIYRFLKRSCEHCRTRGP